MSSPGLDWFCWFCPCGTTACEDGLQWEIRARYMTADGRFETLTLAVAANGDLLVRPYGQPFRHYDKSDRADTIECMFRGLPVSYVMAL